MKYEKNPGIRMWATPHGVPRRTPLARGEFCSRHVAT